jgi:glucosamine-6-phosphate deaminase
MKIDIFNNRGELGSAAAERAILLLDDAIRKKGSAAFIAATGASQFEFLEALTKDRTRVDWSRTTMFHLDEYLGLPAGHPASFRGYLRERLIDRVCPGKVFLIDGEADPARELARLNSAISGFQIDVAFTGIGENGHLAFNDPPADFATADPYIVVDLDERCRKQQLGEGWFNTLESVPRRAISMSIRQIMKSASVLCVVPGTVKAEAVRNCLEKGISPLFPASVLREHPDAHLFLDAGSASLLNNPQGE